MGKVRKNPRVVATLGSKKPSVGSRKKAKAGGGNNKTGSGGKKAGGGGNKVSNDKTTRPVVVVTCWGQLKQWRQ
jgi:hypothetical protein